MAIYRTNTPDVYEARQQDLIFKQFTQDPLQFKELFNVKKSTKGHEDAFEMQGFGTFQLKAEGTPIALDDVAQGPRRRVVHSTFALGYRISMEARADKQHNVVDQYSGDLGDSARDHMENQAFGVFNDSFDGNTHTGMDGLALCTTAHTNVKGDGSSGSLSNELNPGVALSTTALESMITNLRTTLSEEGRRIGAGLAPAVLLVPADLEHTAHNLLEAVKRPGTADNDINTMSRYGMSIKMSPFLSDADDFWVGAAKAKTGLIHFERAGLTTDSGVDTTTKDTVVDAYYRASNVIRGWRGWVGSEV